MSTGALMPTGTMSTTPAAAASDRERGNRVADLMEAITSLAKRRGIAFQSSEIYGGLRSSWDYGPLGAEMRRNIRDAWWREMVQLRDEVVGLEAALLMSPKVWEASGHVAGFSDPLVECENCHHRHRLDQLEAKAAGSDGSGGAPTCPDCGGTSFTEPRQFNLMFQTHIGPVQDDAHVVYLPPETAQGQFVDFEIVQQTSRRKLPFGIAQIRKSFRNEITPKDFIFRTREFEQMEMEYFVKPGEDERWFETWRDARLAWVKSLGLDERRVRLREHDADELAHYAKKAVDIEYEFPFGWSELEGIHNRTDFDLKAHTEASGEDLTYFDQERDERFTPYVIETAVGLDRLLLALLLDAYRVEEVPTAKGGTDKRTVLALSRTIAPVKVAVLPLSRNERLTPEAREVFDLVKSEWMAHFDDAGAIGRRYRRQDEVGTPFCVTVDFESLDDRQVTVRERDSMQQDRIGIENLVAYLRERL
jgi:glycyl-tRNA synthetase